MRTCASDLIETSVRALRLAAFRSVRAGEPSPGLPAIVLLLAVLLGLDAGLGLLSAGNDPGFNEWGIVTGLSGIALFAAVLAVTSLRFPRDVLRRAMADAIAINSLFILVAIGLGAAARFSPDRFEIAPVPAGYLWFGLNWLFLAWMLVAIVRAGCNLWETPVRWAGARLLLAFVLPIVLIPAQPIVYGRSTNWATFDVWYWSREAIATLRTDPGLAEPVDYVPPHYEIENPLYRRAALLNGTLGAIQPGQGDKPQFFFLAAAPNAAQDVFTSEVTKAKAIFDDRFGTFGHSAVLITSSTTLQTVPLATVKNLEVSLQEIGKVMDRRRDVLVLYITSHGAEGFVSVNLPGYPLNQITPEGLANALDDAGIRNRVLIISACHSGSFIPRLQGPNTLIMTAARADRTSFGCANGRAWTYFGDALFNHALREETDLVKAFGKANALITQWEVWRRPLFQKPSEPQISVGSDIVVILQQIEAARHQRQVWSVP